MTESTERIEPQLCMIRPDLDRLPAVELPKGYSIRTSRSGDDAHWARILGRAFDDVDTWPVEKFHDVMVDDPAWRADRIFFVCDAGRTPCATAAAYLTKRWGPNAGYVHYVAVSPDHRGKRLGYVVSLACLHKFRAEGCDRAVLQTDDFRLPAIRTYLRLDFRPLVIHPNQPARWDAVFERLGLKAPPTYRRHGRPVSGLTD